MTGVKHWHGVAPDFWLTHLVIEVPGENKGNEWLEEVDAELEEELAKHEIYGHRGFVEDQNTRFIRKRGKQ